MEQALTRVVAGQRIPIFIKNACREERQTTLRYARRTDRVATRGVRFDQLIFAPFRINVVRVLEVIPRSVALVGLLLIDELGTEHDVAAFENLAGNEADSQLCAVVHIEVIGVLERDLDTFEILARDDVDHAGNGVCAVHGRSTVFQNFDALDHIGGNRLVVTAVHGTVAIDERQGTVNAHSAEVDLDRPVTAVVGRGADWRTRHGRHALQQVTDVGNTLIKQNLSIDDRYGTGTVQVRAFDARSCRDDLLQRLICARILRHRAGCEADCECACAHT